MLPHSLGPPCRVHGLFARHHCAGHEDSLPRNDVHCGVPYSNEVRSHRPCHSAAPFLTPVRNSVRSTNVYEEKSLGIFEEEEDEDEAMEDIENEAAYPKSDGRVAIWGRYLGRHVRHQLSYGMSPTVFSDGE